ncbi:BppU family phage baseplate upper protein, partial [Clostridium sp. 19966]|uniref:BppU family phage baseplate upper protein n=1 Tax=Clostridium sp. 19966 TaxID=2768166 RepID=UPI0028DF089B
MQYIKRINLDIDKNVNVTIDAKQNDTKSRFIEFTLYNNTVVMDLTNHTVKIFAVKADNKLIFNNVTVEDAANGKVLVELTSQALAVIGVLQCEIAIYGSDSSILTTKTFTINVLEGIRNDSAIQSTNEFTALSSALSQTQNWNDQFTSIYPNLDQKYSTRLNALESMQIGCRNLIQNSGFEYSAPVWWGTANGAKSTVDNTVSKEGINSLKIDTTSYTNSSTGFYGTLPTVSGKKYTISGWIYSQTAISAMAINIARSDWTVQTYGASDIPAGVWTYFSQTFIASASYLRIEIFKLNAVYWVDNLELEEGDKATTWCPAPEDSFNYTDNVQIGGRNYIVGSDFIQLNSAYAARGGYSIAIDSSSTVRSYNSLRITSSVAGATGINDWYTYITARGLSAGATFTLTVYVKSQNGSNVSFRIGAGSSSNTVTQKLAPITWTRVNIQLTLAT